MKKHIIPLLTVVVIACLLLVFEADFLWKVQEQNLFLCTWLFFKEQMVVPGGLLTWLGTFFTQFLYHPWLGVTLLAAWWLLLMWLVRRAFRLDGVADASQRRNTFRSLLAVIPVLIILVTIVDMGYWVYILKLRGHFFLTTIGTTAVAALLWAFRVLSVKGLGVSDVSPSAAKVKSINAQLLTLIFPFLACAIGYPLLGIYGLAATLLMSIWIWRLEPRWSRALAVSAVGVLSIIIIPLLCYRHIYYQINLDNLYFAALPLYFITEEYHQYYIPFYLLLAFFVLIETLPQLLPGGKGEVTSSTGKASSKTIYSPPFREGLGVGLLLFASLVYTAYNWYRDENFHHELAMERCIERLDWEGVLREAATQEDEPTRAIVMMRNIALARLGRQGNEMYNYPDGSKRYNAPFDMRMMMVNGPLVYYHYGLLNGCYRLSMEMGVEYDWRAEHLKNLARCAVLNGEWQLARKYTGLLKETLFFDEWADNLDKLIGKPDDIASSPEMGFITHMMHYDSKLTADNGYVEDFLMKRLSNSRNTDDPVFQEQTLYASLFTRDEQMFWKHFVDYVKLHPNVQLPKHVQEAAIFFGSLEERPDVDSWPIDATVRESHRRFCEITPRYDNMDVEPVRKALAPLFGHTYYYYYYLMDNLPQY